MNQIIQRQVLPLVGKVKWDGFNRNSFGNLASLQMKFLKHTRNGDAEKLKKYLALCIQEWPKFEDCPVNRRLIDDALHVIEMSVPI
jgi:hypothetical protein